MRIAEVIGTVTLSRCHPTLVGARWLIGVPFSLKALQSGAPDGEDLVIYDELARAAALALGSAKGRKRRRRFIRRRSRWMRIVRASWIRS